MRRRKESFYRIKLVRDASPGKKVFLRPCLQLKRRGKSDKSGGKTLYFVLYDFIESRVRGGQTHTSKLKDIHTLIHTHIHTIIHSKMRFLLPRRAYPVPPGMSPPPGCGLGQRPIVVPQSVDLQRCPPSARCRLVVSSISAIVRWLLSSPPGWLC